MVCPSSSICWLVNRGLVSFAQAWADQRSLVTARLADPNRPDVLLLLEHPPVYTLGTGSSLEFLKFDPQNSPWEIHRIERGGEVTYHGPGQLVGYPVVSLADNVQSSTPFLGGSAITGGAGATYQTLIPTQVGVVSFIWAASNGFPAGLSMTKKLAEGQLSGGGVDV